MAWRPLLGIILCVDVLVYTNHRCMSAREVAHGINFGRRMEVG
jgi:hypothetical protein